MRNSQRSKESYLLVDHRGSPGLPPHIARRMGYPVDLTAEGKLFETGTLTCAHCRTILILNPERVRERGRCDYCDSYVCDGCAIAMTSPDYIHQPWQKRVDDFVDEAAKPDPFLVLPLLKG